MAIVLMLEFNTTLADKVFHIKISTDEGSSSIDALVDESQISPPPPTSVLNGFNTTDQTG